MGCYEIMLVTPSIRALIHKESSDAIIRDQAYKEGMKPLRVSGAARIDAGTTTVDEVVKVVPLG